MNKFVFKILIVGDAEVGKTAFVRRNLRSCSDPSLRDLTGEFTRNYEATMGAEVTPLVFHTNYGQVTLNVWDLAGQEKFRGLRDGYYAKATGGIVMFDVTSEESYESVPEHVEALLAKGIPRNRIVICGNKVDLRNRTVLPKNITFPREQKIQYYDVSAKDNYNFEKPFELLCRRLTGWEELEFVSEMNDEETPVTEGKTAEGKEVLDETWNSMEDVVVYGANAMDE